jgi:D-sedoheptulose 7-phosphate isomerase
MEKTGVKQEMRDQHASAGSATKIYTDCFREHLDLLAGVQSSCAGALDNLAKRCIESLQGGCKILFFGNGGSAADAQHMATELTVRFVSDRRALAAIALTTDSSALTACGNDLGFEAIFSRQIEALGRPGDVAIGFSTSGNSPNVVRALEMARNMRMTAAAFTGRTGGKLKEVADPILMIPSGSTARIQEMHGLLGHILCAEIEDRLGLVPK